MLIALPVVDSGLFLAAPVRDPDDELLQLDPAGYPAWQGERPDLASRRRGLRLRVLAAKRGGIQTGDPLAHGPAYHGLVRYRS